MIMLSYSNQAYMIHAPIVCAIKHICGGYFVMVLEMNYTYVCPLVSMKFLVRTPFIMSLLYLYIAKLLLELNPMKFNELDHDYWNVFCWSGLIFVNLLDITVQYLTCEYMGSASVCQWLAADILDNDSFKFKSSNVSACPWYSVIPNVFLLPLITCVSVSIMRGTWEKISSGECCGKIYSGFKWSNIYKIYKGSQRNGIYPLQPVTTINSNNSAKNSLNTFPITNTDIKPNYSLPEAGQPEIKVGLGDDLGSNLLLVQSICISNTCLVDVNSLKIKQVNDVLCTTTATLDTRGDDLTIEQINNYNIKQEIIVEPGNQINEFELGLCKQFNHICL